MRSLKAILITAALCVAPIPVAAASATDEAIADGDATGAGQVDTARVARIDAPEEQGNWLVHGRDRGEQRFSPLRQIQRDNVGGLGLAWWTPTRSRRGLEATPLMVDGVLYATSTWSVVFALDAATGEELWRYDPKVPRAKGRDACCDVVNRGVAVWKGSVFVGTIDGRLIAIEAATGKPRWQTMTVDPDDHYTITSAPRVVKDLVVIGNSGAEFGVRGYFSAYDAATGEMRWRFYTVPASKHGPHEHPELAMAAATWPVDALWESGLGGTVWDAMAYDPELDLLYVGVGNASVYNRKLRSPGGGDNLFLASILAVRPETGRLVWHYQTTPGEHWDYTAVQQMILADLEIGDRRRKVLMQAPKNGFFYVLDRASGALLSAEKYAHVSWASHVDLKTGRPVERREAVWEEGSANVAPSPEGAHSWHPMSYSPQTGYVYIPIMDLAYQFIADPDFQFKKGRLNLSEDWGALSAQFEGYEAVSAAACSPTRLVAWDPVRQKKAWDVGFDTSVPGGVVSTAGGLVFQGNGTGIFAAYDAHTGERLWSNEVGIPIMAAPITYQVKGEQYVVVLAGAGGDGGTHLMRLENENEGRVLAWKLGGEAAMPPTRPLVRPPVSVTKVDVPQSVIDEGRDLYGGHCAICHGFGAISSGLHPDLRLSSEKVHADWIGIVLGGTRSAKGMASFADLLDVEDAEAIRAYVISRAIHEPNLLQRLAEALVEAGVCLPASWVTD